MGDSALPDDIAKLSVREANKSDPSPSPSVDSQGIIAEDITHTFASAVQTLAPGELVKDGFFTLFEAVAALEIMDPKMDSGCVAPGEQFEETYDVSQPLQPEQVLGIIDQLLCLEMAWHLGYPLSQTLFTSVYVESVLMPPPKDINHADFVRDGGDMSAQSPMIQVLRAYCLGLLKACGCVNERIASEHFYEEEDFVTNTYHRTLLTNVATVAIRRALEDAQHLLLSLQGPSISQELIEALHQRLELRRVLLDVVECPQYRKQPELARRPWLEALAVTSKLKSSHGLAVPVVESFSAKLQRKLASTMPPRPIVQLEFGDAVYHLTRLLEDGSKMVDVLDFHDTQSLQKFVANFQAKKPQPLVYVRTLLQSFLFTDMEFLGTMSIRQILDDDFAIMTLPASPLLDRSNDEIEAPQDHRFIIAQQMEAFRQRAAQPWLDILRTFCQNRCRVRRTLCHIIREWEILQFDAEEIDQIIQIKSQERPMELSGGTDAALDSYALPLSSWTYYYKLQQMEWIVQFGFELEVYQPDEFAGMYWYLNYLAKSRVQHVDRMRSFLVQRTGDLSNQAQEGNSELLRQIQRALAFSKLSMLDAAVTWELSDALSCLYAVIGRCNLLKVPPRPYSSDELRYELRMKPFINIGLPEMPSFTDFTNGATQAGVPLLDILAYAERALAGAKKGFDTLSKFSAEEAFAMGSHDRWISDTKNGLKSCIAAGIAIATLQKALKQANGSEGGLRLRAEVPVPSKSYHEWWLVPRIVAIT